MEQELDPMVQRRRLRVELRRARAEAGLTQREVAEALDWSLSKLLRIENGQVSLSTTDLNALLSHYGVTNRPRVAEFQQMAKQSRRPTWSSYKDVLNPEFVIYLGYESSASLFRQFEPVYIPGLLQTSDYARAIITSQAAPGRSSTTIERQIEARLARQAILDRADPPEMFFILDEAVVRRWVGLRSGDPTVMIDQLKRLKELNERPTVNIQIVPFTYGTHYGMKGSFVILEFSDPRDDDLLFVESPRGAVVTRDDADEIELYKRVFFDLEDAAINKTMTSSFIDSILAEMTNSVTRAS